MTLITLDILVYACDLETFFVNVFCMIELQLTILDSSTILGQNNKS